MCVGGGDNITTTNTAFALLALPPPFPLCALLRAGVARRAHLNTHRMCRVHSLRNRATLTLTHPLPSTDPHRLQTLSRWNRSWLRRTRTPPALHHIVRPRSLTAPLSQLHSHQISRHRHVPAAKNPAPRQPRDRHTRPKPRRLHAPDPPSILHQHACGRHITHSTRPRATKGERCPACMCSMSATCPTQAPVFGHTPNNLAAPLHLTQGVETPPLASLGAISTRASHLSF